MIQISPNVYVEPDYGPCNLGLVTTKEGVVMIDTPMRPTEALKWRDEVKRRIGETRFLINTEEHPDHCTTSFLFPGVLITSEETRSKLANKSEEVVELLKSLDPEGLRLLESFELRLADIAFTGNLNLYLGDHTFRLFALPGHTSGGIGVWVPEEHVVFTGDCVFHRMKSWLGDAEPDQWLESLGKLARLDVDTIVPGHGTVCKKDYLQEQAHIIRQWMEVVKSAVKEGLSQDEAVANISCPDPYPIQAKTQPDAQVNANNITRLYHLYKALGQSA